MWPDPVEIDCRWDEVTKLVVSGQTSGKPGEEVVAHATVLVNIDLKYGGFLSLVTWTIWVPLKKRIP